MILILTIFTLFNYQTNSQTVEYIAATTNPPHGCPNYGLCTDVTKTLVSETNVSTTYQYGCAPDNCVCVDGVTNTSTPCDTIVDQCTSDPCGDAQYFKCTSKINSYTCGCQAGFTGTDCDSEIGSACGTAPCQNGGTCDSSSNGTDYTCNCADGYSGTNCENKDMCYGVNCQNGRNCTMILDNSNYYCDCGDDYQGRKCEYSNDLSTAPTEDGCYEYDYVSIGGTSTKFQDGKMTIDMCNSYALEQTDTMNYLTLCGAWCMVSESPIVNTSSYMNSDCKRSCGGNSSQYCGRLNVRCMVYEVGVIDEDPNPCVNTTLCNADAGNGKCINWREFIGDGYGCICGPFWTGADCETPVESACASSPCVNGTCVLNSQFNTYTCDCDPGFVGDQCQYEETCTTSTCLYGGTCEETNNGGYKCECLNLYSGSRCQEIDRCDYGEPCVHGDCHTTVDGITPDFTCDCDSGWTGVNCDTMIDFCDPNPCSYNSTCVPFFKGYNCTCLTGLTGVNCSTIIDLCVGKWEDGQWLKSPCNTKDDQANCTIGINTFTCSCSAKWTDTLCDLNVLIKDVLMAIYGYVDLNMITLLNDLMQNPSQIKDMVPFITGLLSASERSDLSWDVEDLFNWIAFEDKRLNLQTDIYKWNDVVLGNCFTFNHREQNFTYMMRSSGKHGGIMAFMRTQQDEYAPWYDTAAINVFIHNKEDYVFSESVRYNAEPNAQATINMFMTRYTRLGGRYGKCIKKPSEVKAYYYPGSYTTDGCLRTCYQNMIQEACNCMDPRYPQGDNATSCQLSERSCVTDASDAAGDPSTWPTCVCPLPCSNQEYSVTWSKADFVKLPRVCEMSSDVAACQYQYTDNLMISIVLPQMDYKIYAENPAMDFNKFLSQLGGQLGVLMGINLVTFIEVAFFVFGIFMVCCRKYN